MQQVFTVERTAVIIELEPSKKTNTKLKLTTIEKHGTRRITSCSVEVQKIGIIISSTGAPSFTGVNAQLVASESACRPTCNY